MDEEIQTVRGHTCPGLASHYAAATSQCTPEFGGSGDLVGCDDTNHVLIAYCPYCGVLLPPPTDEQERNARDELAARGRA